MWKALVTKELRETLPIVALGLLACLCFVSGDMGSRLSVFVFRSREEIPLVSEGFRGGLVQVTVLLMIALGLRQTVGESLRGTWQFLLHRPAERGQMIGVKLAVGLLLSMGCSLVPILVYARWAATPGNHASPFEWSMTLPTWQAWFSMSAIYLAAVLSGVRPGRWFGSRLLPLAGTGQLALLLQLLPWWWLLGMAAVVLLDAWLIAEILHVVRTRDY